MPAHTALISWPSLTCFAGLALNNVLLFIDPSCYRRPPTFLALDLFISACPAAALGGNERSTACPDISLGQNTRRWTYSDFGSVRLHAQALSSNADKTDSDDVLRLSGNRALRCLQTLRYIL